MNNPSAQHWSPVMKAALAIFVWFGITLCVVLIVSAARQLSAAGRLETALLWQILGSAGWSAFFAGLRKHPEWMHERF